MSTFYILAPLHAWARNYHQEHREYLEEFDKVKYVVLFKDTWGVRLRPNDRVGIVPISYDNVMSYRYRELLREFNYVVVQPSISALAPKVPLYIKPEEAMSSSLLNQLVTLQYPVVGDHWHYIIKGVTS